MHKFHDCTIWTKSDLRQGYHQMVLEPESRAVPHLAHHRGTTEQKGWYLVFDDIMQKIFGDIT